MPYLVTETWERLAMVRTIGVALLVTIVAAVAISALGSA